MEPRTQWSTEIKYRLWILAYTAPALRVSFWYLMEQIMSIFSEFDIFIFYGQRFAIPDLFLGKQSLLGYFSLLLILGVRGFTE